VQTLERLSSEKKDDEWLTLFDQCMNEYPDHLPLTQLRLHHLDRPHIRGSQLAEIAQCCDEIVARIDERALAAFYGLKPVEDETVELKTAKVESDKQKAILIDALTHKATAIADLEQLSVLSRPDTVTDGGEPPPTSPLFADAVQKLMQWDDIFVVGACAKYAPIVAAYRSMRQQHASVVSYVSECLKEDTPLEAELYALKKRVIRDSLGWKHISDYDALWECINKPKQFALF
jgi:hypothetical protein